MLIQKQQFKMFYKIGVLKSKVAGFQLWASNFIKKDTPTQVLWCKFGEILRTLFLQTASGWLVLLVSLKPKKNNYREAPENINKNGSYEAKDIHKIYIKTIWNLK